SLHRDAANHRERFCHSAKSAPRLVAVLSHSENCLLEEFLQTFYASPLPLADLSCFNSSGLPPADCSMPSNVSLPSSLASRSFSLWRDSNSFLRDSTCITRFAGVKSSMLLNLSSTLVLPPSFVKWLSTLATTRG